MTKIDSVKARAVAVPLANVTSFSTRQVATRHYALVEVTDIEGITGVGFCYAGHAGGTIISETIRLLLAPLVEGRDSTEVRSIWDDLYAAVLLHGRTGSVMRAMSALDIALWDLSARAVSLPLWRYLGAARREVVPAYASGGYYLEGKTPQDLADEVSGYVNQGFDIVKIKVGRVPPKEDAQRLAAARDAVGSDIQIALDANNAWRDLPEALRAIRMLEPYDPFWIEEPFGPDDIDNHARLAEETGVTVATGEIEAGRWRHRELLDKGAAEILQTDAAVCGGITEFQRIAATADSYGVRMAPHWFHDLHAHLVASISNGMLVEFFPDAEVLNFRTLISQQLETDGRGNLVLPERPGLGFDWDTEVVDRFATEGWN